MLLAIFGATGGTGRQLVEQALAAGHQVRALVRDPAKLPVQNPGQNPGQNPVPDPALEVITGNVLDPVAVERTVAEADAVLVSLGNTDNNPDMVVTEGTRTVISAMRAANVRRLVVISSLGVGDSKEMVPFFFKALMATVLRKAMQDKEAQEQLVKASGLDWVIVRPSGLTDGPATGNVQVGVDIKPRSGQVSRADVAAFALQQVTSADYVGKTPAITG